MFPMTPTLRTALERQRARTREIERAEGLVIPWMFHRDGQPIKHFRRARLTACKAATTPHRIPHDFRRTAVRNLERAVNDPEEVRNLRPAGTKRVVERDELR